MSEEVKKCIYCGREIKPHEGYLSGRICGMSNQIMCLDCANGDGAKYLESYYDGYKPKQKTIEEYEKEREAHREKGLDPVIKDVIWYVVISIVFWGSLFLYGYLKSNG